MDVNGKIMFVIFIKCAHKIFQYFQIPLLLSIFLNAETIVFLIEPQTYISVVNYFPKHLEKVIFSSMQKSLLSVPTKESNGTNLAIS